MPAAVIGHDDTVGPKGDCPLGIGRMQDAFDHERPLPALAQSLELLPGVAAAAAQLHGARGRDLRRLAARIGGEIGGDRHAVAQERQRPRGRGQHLECGPRIDRERNGHAVADIARTFRLAGAVHGRHQHVGAGRVGTAHQIERDLMIIVRKSIELEPEDVRRDRGDLLDRGIGRCRQHIGNARALGLTGETFFDARPHQSGRAHRRHANRCGIAAAEKFQFGRHALAGDAIARQQLDRELPHRRREPGLLGHRSHLGADRTPVVVAPQRPPGILARAPMAAGRRRI